VIIYKYARFSKLSTNYFAEKHLEMVFVILISTFIGENCFPNHQSHSFNFSCGILTGNNFSPPKQVTLIYVLVLLNKFGQGCFLSVRLFNSSLKNIHSGQKVQLTSDGVVCLIAGSRYSPMLVVRFEVP
jgi:hypothetical protein